MEPKRLRDLVLTHPLRASSVVGYVATCLLPLSGAAVGSEMGTAWAGGALAWPYPLLLPFKPFFSLLGPLETLAADAGGLVGVYALSRYLEYRLGPAGQHPLAAWAIGVISWPFFLAVVNGLLFITGIGYRPLLEG